MLREAPGARCGMVLGYPIGTERFVDIATRAPSQSDGRDWRRCSRCKTWNIFEAVAG